MIPSLSLSEVLVRVKFDSDLTGEEIALLIEEALAGKAEEVAVSWEEQPR